MLFVSVSSVNGYFRLDGCSCSRHIAKYQSSVRVEMRTVQVETHKAVELLVTSLLLLSLHALQETCVCVFRFSST